jgi:CheY-like chemotaxis protein
MSDPIHVLVVDDHPVNRVVLAQVFGGLGCEVSLASDGDEALAMATIEPFELVCLDRHMPGLSGDEVAARLAPERFVVAFSTDLKDLPLRFNDVLCKPVTCAGAARVVEAARAWRSAARAMP